MEKEALHITPNFQVRKYTTNDAKDWNQFVAKSKNSTFLFLRKFMDYHQDRFDDFSLLVFKNEKLVALLPANKVGKEVYSHQGLSYGGFVITSDIRFEDYLKALQSVLMYLEDASIETFYIKPIPSVYHSHLSNEMQYVLPVLEAKLDTLDSYFVMDTENYKPNRNRKRAIKLAESKATKITNTGIEFFWEHILTKNLDQRFKAKPVHTINEIQSLKEQFPEHIKFYAAEIGNELVAGAVLFISSHVAHFQYSSGTDERNENGALDALFHYIIKKHSHKSFISFGSSSTDSTLKINKGLAYWKESFGAHVMPQERYIIDPKNHFKLERIFK